MGHENVRDEDNPKGSDKPFVQINFVNAHELKPNAKYLIVVSQEVMDESDVRKLTKSLGEMGIKNAVALHVPGDPDDAVKIIEQKESK